MIGKTVGHYLITAKPGAGGMGEVFLADDTRLDRKAAIKFLPADVAGDPDRRQRFLTEAKAASALNHPHVCVVYDVGETADGLPFISLEFVEGQSLGSLVNQGHLEISAVVQIAAQVADALDAAHSRRIVHRDIKPENISLNERGEVKVLDFGLAKRMLQESDSDLGKTADVQQTRDGQVLGTPRLAVFHEGARVRTSRGIILSIYTARNRTSSEYNLSASGSLGPRSKQSWCSGH
jgi:serine/threonine protein kinase